MSKPLWTRQIEPPLQEHYYGCNQAKESSTKLPLEINQAQESLHPVYLFGCSPVGYFHLTSVPQVRPCTTVILSSFSQALCISGFGRVFPRQCTHNDCGVLESFGESEDIIQINDDKLMKHISKYVIYGMLEDCQGLHNPNCMTKYSKWSSLVQKVVFYSSLS